MSINHRFSSKNTPQFPEYSRRDLLRIAAASVGGVSCSGWLPALAAAVEGKPEPQACILLWMAGGPSQLETLDPKPGHGNGGPTQSIQTAVPGIEICDIFRDWRVR
jgi:hypothetical protein